MGDLLTDHEEESPSGLGSLRFSRRFCQRKRILPLARRGRLAHLACPRGEEPDAAVLGRISQNLGCDVFVEALEAEDWECRLRAYQEAVLDVPDQTFPALEDPGDLGEIPEDALDEGLDKDALDRLAHEAPVVALVNELIRKAAAAGASDLHLEARHKYASARIRVDGVLEHLKDLDVRLFGGISSRIKVMANLNIMERRQPQDGRLRFDLGSRMLELRVSILPASHGESLVLRLLETEDGLAGLEDLGLDAAQLELFKLACSGTGGLILVTGPTGSGKTSTLHALLRHCRRPGVKIIALEDPVERVLDQVVQIQVNEDAGLDFASLLRRVLRHDPDIIMVGEIRDEKTAQLALRSALTGHVVLSTLHTTSALGAVDRLVSLGCDPALLAGTLKVLASQRLVRGLCPACRGWRPPTDREAQLLELAGMEADLVPEPRGCKACGNSGFVRRFALWEVVALGGGLVQALGSGARSGDLESLVDRNACPGLEDQARRALGQGLSTLEELWREVLG